MPALGYPLMPSTPQGVLAKTENNFDGLKPISWIVRRRGIEVLALNRIPRIDV